MTFRTVLNDVLDWATFTVICYVGLMVVVIGPFLTPWGLWSKHTHWPITKHVWSTNTWAGMFFRCVHVIFNLIKRSVCDCSNFQAVNQALICKLIYLRQAFNHKFFSGVTMSAEWFQWHADSADGVAFVDWVYHSLLYHSPRKFFLFFTGKLRI